MNDASRPATQPVTQLLAAFAAKSGPATQSGAIPPDAARMMSLSLLDWAAVAIAGKDEPVARLTRQMAQEDGGTPDAVVIGSDQRLPARSAALVNGATSHALDYDDTHFAHIGHPSVAVVPAALAVAARVGADGTRLRDAALIGVETSVRLGVWLGRSHYQTGFHQTGTAGAFGATAAAGHLLGLDADTMAHALGLVATRASGLKSQFGTMGKPYNAGIAAANGVEAALLAASGMISNPEGIECAQGFGPTHAGTTMAELPMPQPGAPWLFESVSHKFHACCHGTHAMLEALAELRALHGLSAEDVEHIELTTHPRWMAVCNIPTPRTGLEVKFSYRHAAAMALSGRDTGALDSFTDALATDAGLRALAEKVVVTASEEVPETAARLRITLQNGRTVEAAHDLNQPITLDARADKLAAKVRALLGETRAQALSDAVLGTSGPDLRAFETVLQAG